MTHSLLPRLISYNYSLLRKILFFGFFCQQYLGIGMKNNLSLKTHNMLESASRDFYNDSIFRFNINLMFDSPNHQFGLVNYVDVIIDLFFVLEGEFSCSIVQYMRWKAGSRMPEEYNQHSPGLKMFYSARDSSRKVNFNKFKVINGLTVWISTTSGEAINCFEVFSEHTHIELFKQGNKTFIQDFRKLIDTANSMRHFQHGFVSQDEAFAFKAQLDHFLSKYQSALYAIKRALRGDNGYDIEAAMNAIINELNQSVVDDLLDSAD